jgi:hypothetical protein
MQAMFTLADSRKSQEAVETILKQIEEECIYAENQA